MSVRRFNPRRSLRVRVALCVAVLSMVLTAGIGITVYAVTQHNSTNSARGDGANSVIVAAYVYDHTGQVVTGAVRDDLSAPAPLRRAVAAGLLGTYVTGSEIWAGTPLPGGTGIYVENANPTTHTLATLRATILIVGGVAVLLATGLGVLLANGLSRELRAAATVADRVASGELDARIAARGQDEVARLGNAIDAMAAALSDRIERERRFSADVAHELRTPLTALVSAGALLGEERAAQIVRERVAALRALVEDLLEISRLEQGGEQVRLEPVDLGALVRLTLEARGSDTEVAVALGEHAPVASDPRRLERIVSNLLDNASRHGGAPITVRVEDHVITVRDSGPGFPQELLHDGPVPFRTGAAERGTGTGLGLTIAAAQATALGARLRLENLPEGGAQASVVLPLEIGSPPAARPRSEAGTGN
jgi:signal transduction histidine kinase